ncbi:hypothetical protein WR25_20787 isoform E [Diploscapter pachys]|uniref:Palmitoyltransferase n=2 Tax=Diploscapter pachys TaxID=2018661 RepID=A0A2A2KDU9_9BILA|nr:hypothetical protein WR25_20787 isoform C [Diploscapter pachys]PAV72102.1 hypothetical protein WR25_20787 isoform E [Diploscapter pachys]
MFQRDPCGLACVFIIYLCIGYADYVVTVWLVHPIFGQSFIGLTLIGAFNILILLTLTAHGRCMLTDPGVVPFSDPNQHRSHVNSSDDDDESASDGDAMMQRSRSGYAIGDNWTMCTRCKSFRPPRAHHCRVCKRCIRRMDHHCPWVNTCIGEFNQKYFLQFLFWVGMTSLFSMLIIGITWVYDDEHASTGINGKYGENAHHVKVLHSIFLAMEAALFGMFVLAVSCDQVSAIFSDETAVEAVQRRSRMDYRRSNVRRRSRMSLLKEVCGRGMRNSTSYVCYEKLELMNAGKGLIN